MAELLLYILRAALCVGGDGFEQIRDNSVNGTQNSTVAELRAYLDGYRRELDARMPGAVVVAVLVVVVVNDFSPGL